MTAFIKVKTISDTVVLLDLSIIEGFFQKPDEPNVTIAHYKAPYVMKGKDQEYIFLAHSVTEISNAIQAQMQCVEVVDLTLDDMAEPENESTEE